MPLWTFVCESTGELVDEFCPRDKRPEFIERDGKRFQFSLSATHQGHHHVSGTWPMKSVSVGVAPEQVDAAIAADHKNGVPADYCRKTGDKIFRSPGEKRRWCEKYGYYDRNAGYSDPQRK